MKTLPGEAKSFFILSPVEKTGVVTYEKRKNKKNVWSRDKIVG